MRIRSLAAAATAAGATLLLSACGGGPLDGMDGPEVATAAADALEGAGAVHVEGTMTEDGEEIDLDLDLQDDDAAGTLTMGGIPIDLISVDGTAYLQAPPEFWTSFGLPEEAAAMFDGQWVIVPAEAAAGFEEFTLSGLVDSLRDPESPVQGEVTTDRVDGQDVVVVEQEDGSTLSVADDEPAYPLQMTSQGASEGTVTFSEFGEEQDITAPSDALDLIELVAGG